MTQVIVEALLTHAGTFPEKIALISDEKTITYQQLSKRIFTAADFLNGLGIQKGERVLLAAASQPGFVYAYFACHLLGIICVPVDSGMSDDKLNFILSSTGAKALFSVTKIPLPNILNYSIDVFSELELITSELDFPLIKQDSIADILFTSGTTGDPKGVVLSHRAISSAADNINSFIGNTIDDKEVMPLPLSHSFGLGRLRCNMVIGSSVILVPGMTSPSLIFNAIDANKATGFSSVPAGFSVLLKSTGEKLGFYKNQLRYIEIGSSTMSLKDKELLMKLLPSTRICMHYGLTEASRSAFIEFHGDQSKLSSVGRASPGVNIKICDQDGNELVRGSAGRILVQGTHQMSFYWNERELSKKVFENGWLVTGDRGIIDDEGYLYLQARESDIINVGGRKVSPLEIEELLNQHDGVFASVCVGVPDPRGITGSAVKAFLVASSKNHHPRSVELAKLLRGKIETYKMPVAYQWIESIPATESGKIKRNAMLEEYEVTN